MMRISLAIFVLAGVGISNLTLANDGSQNLKVIAIHQIDDEVLASFDFFTAEMGHQCGGNPSNRYRSYNRQDIVAERKFQLVLSALEHGFTINIEPLTCEGNAMKVGRIGVRK